VNPLWTYLWPLLAIGLVCGAVAGRFAFRRNGRLVQSGAIGIAVAAVGTFLWHSPLGAATAFQQQTDRFIRINLDGWEMPQIEGKLHQGPLSRRAILTGTADDFQRRELVRIIGDVPGVSTASWSDRGPGVPLLIEGFGGALLGFLFGWFLAYLAALHRRHNAQWSW